MVGERGPELVMLPTGATVIPHHETSRMSLPSYPDTINLTSIIKLDNRVLAKSVQKHKLDAQARE